MDVPTRVTADAKQVARSPGIVQDALRDKVKPALLADLG